MKPTSIRCRAAFTLAPCAVLLFMAALPGVQLSAQKIVKFDVPGADMTAGSNNGTFPAGINNWAAITGYYVDVKDVYYGFLRSPDGGLTSFQAPGADTTAGSFNGTDPTGINDLGAITGEYWDVSGTGHGFLRSPDGKFTTFDAPGAGGYGTTPLAINLGGAVVGYYSDSNFAFHAFLRSPDGKFTTWTGPDACTGNGSEGCYGTGASNINAFGMLVGGFQDDSGYFVHHSFVRSADGKLKTFDVPDAGKGLDQGTGCPGCALGLN